MSARGPGAFYVNVDDDGALVLRGQLDIGTIQDLQDKIDDVMVPGVAIVLDMAQLTFLDSSAIHCFIKACQVTGHRVVLRNAHLLFAASSSWPTPRQSPKHGCSTEPDSVGLPVRGL